MKSQVLACSILFVCIILFSVNFIVTETIATLVQEHMTTKLVSDITYIEDIISHDAAGDALYWNVRDGFIYYGDVPIGNGVEETAYLKPFLEHHEKTGIFGYVFILDENARLGYVESDGEAIGYSEGRYLRVAGSTRGPNGESIVGTYMARDVSDVLDKQGYYHGEANVAGGLIYSYYKTLTNEKGEIVGAMVVGQFISELKKEIAKSVQKINIVTIAVLLAVVAFAIKMLSNWVASITETTRYLKKIESGVLPYEKLVLSRKNEISRIADSINSMVKSLHENRVLRKMSETDALTDLANRFALEFYSKQLEEQLGENPEHLAVEIIDIDYFKQYNDNYGHQAGDDCIRGVANEISDLVANNENVFACRYGGDEFMLIYRGYSREEVEEFTHQLRQRVKARKIEHSLSKVSGLVTLTQGVAFGMFKPGQTVAQYLECADRALYEVKKSGRDGSKVLELADTPEIEGLE